MRKSLLIVLYYVSTIRVNEKKQLILVMSIIFFLWGELLIILKTKTI